VKFFIISADPQYIAAYVEDSGNPVILPFCLPAEVDDSLIINAGVPMVFWSLKGRVAIQVEPFS
jgi:hypothetical protein